MLFTCVMVSACGNKYEDMQFKVYYAFSENSSEWLDGSDGISLNYMTNEDKESMNLRGVSFDESALLDFSNSKGVIYVRVEVENVKSKHLDQVVVNASYSSGLNFKSQIVSVGEAFSIEVTGNVRTTLNFYETNSKKSTKVNLSIYRSVTDIDIDSTVMPAFKVGNSISLSKIDNLICQPNYLTNQTEIIYSASAIGYFNNSSTFIAQASGEGECLNYINLTSGGVLRWTSSNYDEFHNVVKIKATSAFNPEISKEFYVYVERGGNYEPEVTFTSNGYPIDMASGNKIVLANNGTNRYSSTGINIGIGGSQSYYANGDDTENGLVKYETEIYIDGVLYDVENNTLGINGILISQGDGEDDFIVTLGSSISSSVSELKIREVIKDFDFSASTETIYKNYYEKIIKIEKQILPSKISVNGTMYTNEYRGEEKVYSIDNDSYRGLELNLTAAPTNNSENIYFEIDNASGLQVRDVRSNDVDLDHIPNNSKIYIKFSGAETEANIIIKTRSNPVWFDGVETETTEYISIGYKLTKSVTASKIELFIDEGCTQQASTTSTYINETNLIVDANGGSNLYAKIYHKGDLDQSSISLSTNNNNVGVQKTLVGLGYSSFSDGSLYVIPLTANEINKSSSITVVAGDGNVGTSASAMALTRSTLTTDDVNNKLYITPINNAKNNMGGRFSVAKGEFAEFAVEGIEHGVYDVVVEKDGENSFTTQETSATTFSLIGGVLETAKFKVNVVYYSYDLDGKYFAKAITPLRIEVACYDAIGVFSTSNPTNSELTYVNNFFNEAATTSFTITPLTSSSESPSIDVKFDNNTTTIADVNGYIISFNEVIAGLLKDDKDGVDIKIDFDGEELENGKIVNLNGNDVKDLTITLYKDINIDNIPIVFTALRFGEKSKTSYVINVPVYKVDRASNILISGDNIVKYSDTTYELQLSFIDVVDGLADESFFFAELEYDSVKADNVIRFDEVNNDNMTYKISEYVMDTDGVLTTKPDGSYDLNECENNRLIINFEDGKVTIGALKSRYGGLFRVVIATKDSYYENTDENGVVIESGFANKFELDVRVSDGETKGKAFILYTDEDIANMNSKNSAMNLGKHFVLGADIYYEGNPIGAVQGAGANNFTGTLSGKLERNGGTNYYTLTVKIKNSAQSTGLYGYVYGLFASIGANAEISDLNLVVTFDDAISDSNGNGVNIGGLAGVNHGTIKNVNVTVLDEHLVSLTANSDVNFGLIAAVNTGTIELKNSIVECKSGLVVECGSKQNYNIGLVSGVNYGTIEGNYEGKYSLNSVVFDVLSNLSVQTSLVDPEDVANVNVGVAAGYSENLIRNLLVSGKVEVYSGQNLKGYLGGIVGSCLGGVETVAALGLDIDACKNVTAGGIVGLSEGNITNAKFISAKTTTSAGDTEGRIKANGSSKIAGIVGETVDGSIYACSVESFINKGYDENVFYTLDGVNVGGLALGDSITARCGLSFVHANIKSSNSIVLTSGLTNPEPDKYDTYFVGATSGSVPTEGNSAYAVILTLNNDADVISAKYYSSSAATPSDVIYFDRYVDNSELKCSEWEAFIGGLIGVTDWDDNSTNWRKNSTFNAIKYGNITFYFPYLVDGAGNAIMIERPTDIKTPLNSDYNVTAEDIIVKPFTLNSSNLFEKTESVVDVDIFNAGTFYTYNITTQAYEKATEFVPGTPYYVSKIFETMVVNYYYAANKSDNEIQMANTHKLITKNGVEGLVDLEILPETASAGVTFKVVSGYRYATIVNNDEIIFTGISGNTPIIIRAYSLFDEDVESYVVLYTQMLASSLELSSNIVSKVSTNHYVASLYTGQAEQLIKLTAENLFKGNFYQSIFDYYGVESSLTLRATTVDDYLSIDTSSVNNISVAIKEDASFVGTVNTSVKFTLYLNKNYFVGATAPEEIEICSVDVDFALYESATSLVLGGDSAYSVPSSDVLTISATLLTGWVSAEDLNGKLEAVELKNNRFEIVLATGDSRDTIYISFNDISNGSYLSTYINALYEAGVFGSKQLSEIQIIDLFETPIIKTTSIYDAVETTKCIGYQFDILLELKDNRKVRSLTSNLEFEITLSADSDSDVNDSVEVTYKPTNVSTARIENYAVVNIAAKNGLQAVVEKHSVETALIDPNSKGNLMIIYLEPEYAYFNEVTLTTSTENIPSLGREVGLQFSQYVFNETNNRFETLLHPDYYGQNGNTINLLPISSAAGDYTGVIYVYVQLEKFGGKEVDFTATLNVNTGNNEEIEIIKNLTTSYLPSVKLEYNGAKIRNSEGEYDYLVQTGSFNNSAHITLFGYQFNSKPIVTIEWDLTDVTGYNYIDGKKYEIAKANNVELDPTSGKYKLIAGKVSGVDSYIIGNYVQKIPDFGEATFNPTDESYSMEMFFNVPKKETPAPFKISVELSLIDKNNLNVTDRASLTLHPTDYILKDINISNITNNKKNLVIGSTTKLEFGFDTENTTGSDKMSEELYKKLIEDVVVGENYDVLAGLFYYYDGGEIKLEAGENSHECFNVNVVTDTLGNKNVTIYGKAAFSNKIYLKVTYTYVIDSNSGAYNLKFGTSYSDYVDYSFELNIMSATTDENAYPINSAEDMFDSNGNCILQEGSYNILMNDIVVENIKPININIASLDGNNRRIIIKSFAVEAEQTNYGLFANLGSYLDADGKAHQSILKNVIVDYSQFTDDGLQLTNNQITQVVFGGLVAQNSGLIYNCDVINHNSTKQAKVEILIDDSADVSVTFGGLVGENQANGVVTNSRVGRETFTSIQANATTESVSTYTIGKLLFVIGNAESATNKFNVVSGAFVGKNAGIISTSYVKNTSLTNYSTSETTNKTAGFAGENSKEIHYSFVEATNTKTSTNPYSTGSVIENKGNGIVSGFVYSNSGIITNAYANIELQTSSAYISGFVYENLYNASISECYAAATMNSALNIGNTNTFAEQPFVGVDKSGVLLSDGELKNCYYLLDGYNYALTEGNKPQASPLNVDNFSNKSNLTGFVFILSSNKSEREQGVWSYYDINGKLQKLPTLINAEIIAHSYRFIVETKTTAGAGEINRYSNAASYELGTKNNPYIVADVAQFNNAFTVYESKYVRLINNIDFESDNSAIQTRAIKLGNAGYNNVTSIEGNGLTISGIYFDAGTSVVEKIGLFAEIENAYIRNLNLNFATPPKPGNQFSTANVYYSGGLAGVIKDSVILNISLNGSNTTLTGQNYVGSLAGLVEGTSLLYGIRTNLSVKAANRNENIYYNLEDYKYLRKGDAASYDTYRKQLSFAGGVAGVLDLEKRSTDGEEFNVSYIDVYGSEMAEKTNNNGQQEANILASFAGGVAGYASKETNSFKLKYHTGTTDLIRGDKVAAGIYAISLGSITASQVTADEEIQYKYDTTLGTYVMSLGTGEESTYENILTGVTPNVDFPTGNLKLIESYGYAGGLIGVSVGASVNACYSKVGFKSGLTIGGLIGASVAGNLRYSYAVPYINIENVIVKNILDGELYKTRIGGLIGAAYKLSSLSQARNAEIQAFEKLAKKYAPEINEVSNDIQFAFSTLLMNKSELTEINKDAQIDKDKITLDYLCADANVGEGVLTSSQSESLLFVYVGNVDYSTANEVLKPDGSTEVQIINSINNSTTSSAILMYDIYNLDSTEQEIAFNEVFSGWNNNMYWSLNNEKYFPLLIKDPNTNFETIATEQEFHKIIANPNGNYKIIDNIVITDNFYKGGNWVFNVNFTGILVGQIENSDNRPFVLISEALNPNKSHETAGLFKQTTGATINNITFVWQETMNIERELGIVSGLTCVDDGSTISSVDVHVDTHDDHNYLIGSGSTADDRETQPIVGFGGIIGDGKNSNVLGCRFSGSVNATLSSSKEVYFGAVVAKAMGIDDGDTDDTESMSVSDCLIGVSNNAEVTETTGKTTASYTPGITAFNLDLNNYTSAYIGSAIGKAQSLSISSINVGSAKNIASYKSITLTVNVSNTEIVTGTSGENYPNNIGGLAGWADESATTNCDLNANITVTGNATALAGGLFGFYSVSSVDNVKGIRNSNSFVNINVDTTNSIQAYAAAGVAMAAGNVQIQQCLFTGEIVAGKLLDGTVDPKVGTTYAAGAVAQAFGAELKLQEVMSTVNVKAVGEKLFAGGLVGHAANDLDISYSATSGKLVPICTTEGYVGGLVGCLGVDGQTSTIELLSIYSTTSVVADGIEATNIKNATINALLGYNQAGAEITTNNIKAVFYSTDIALAPEANLPYATNLSANDLWFNGSWHNELNNVQLALWSEIKSTDSNNYLPYIGTIENELVTYSVIVSNNYVLGTSLRPYKLVSDVTNFAEYEDKYTYFLSANPEAEFSGSLNGIVVGSDAEVVGKVKLSSKTSGEEQYKGIISHVLAGSAVSNMHVEIVETSNKTINVGGVTGLIVGLNEGVVFNSSVQGNALTISSTIENSSVGLVVGKNDGMVSYCYSTAEILTINENVKDLAGIVFQNNGKLVNNYFTGYINNSKTAAGIVVQPLDGYIYNNYMAGVVRYISAYGNSFSANEESSNFAGSRNYIDTLANIENVEKPELITVTTTELMANRKFNGEAGEYVDSLLVGCWDTVVDFNPSNTMATNINMHANTYGYNYNYPVYQFNKVGFDNKTHQLKTGYGATLQGDEFIESTSSPEYKDQYKVPHLGVLSSIQGLLSEEIQLYFTLIYDIDGKHTSWTAVGVNSLGAHGYASTNKGFTGHFSSNKNFDDSTDKCLITNLTNNGLFANVNGGAWIGDLTLGNFTSLNNSGALGTTVKGSATIGNISFNGDSVINIADLDESIDNYVGALFGIVQGDESRPELTELTITNLDTSNVSIYGIDSEEGIIGLIAGKAKNFKISIPGGTTIDTTLLSKIYGVKYAGGLVGELVSSEIYNENNVTAQFGRVKYAGGVTAIITDSTISNKPGEFNTINLVSSNEHVEYYGGIVAHNNSADKSNITANLTMSLNEGYSGTKNLINAKVFGGIVAVNDNTLIFKNINFKTNVGDGTYVFGDETETFGLIAGVQKGDINTEGEINIENFTEIMLIGAGANEDNTTSGAGVLVGYRELANLTVKFGTKNLGLLNGDEGLKLRAEGISNVGGVAGYYKGPEDITTIITTTAENFGKVQVQGTMNVGGLFGKAEGTISKKYKATVGDEEVLKHTISINGTDENALSADNEFATVYVGGAKDAEDSKNFGGLFGWLTANITDAEGNITDESGDPKVSVVNKNKFGIASVEGSIKNYAKNIGGIAGKFTGTTAAGFTNSANIYTVTYEDTDLIDIKSVEQVNSEYIVRTINVGGIFGCVDGGDQSDDGIVITHTKNTSSVNGYQNVGGLVGYVTGKASLIGSLGIDAISLESTASKINDDADVQGIISGVISVGGVVGYADEHSVVQGVFQSGAVNGNANVGGIVGTANKAAVTNNYLHNSENQLNIKGVYYTYHTKNHKDKDQLKEFIPTNIGGLFGQIVDTTTEYNILNDVLITSADEGNDYDTISTIQNYMAPVGCGNAATTSDIIDLNADNIVKFSEVQSGYGGFAGSIDFYTMRGNDKTDRIEKTRINLLNDLEINAKLGINVGTFYGSYVGLQNIAIAGEDLTHSHIVPTLKSTSTTLIDGAYNVGGVIGYVSADNGLRNTDNAMIANLNSDADILLQSRNVGLYVGGFYGKVQSSEVTGLQITNNIDNNKVNIIIDTSRSYYMGGLIGQLEINKTNIFTGNIVGAEDTFDVDGDGITTELNPIISQVTTSAFRDMDSASNFGGLVGMLKSTTANVTINVEGSHMYPFTVNTILNSGYTDGATQSGAEVSPNGKDVTLLAQAYYVNIDNFNISATKDESWYGTSASNPLREYSTGWAKEYTGFKTVSRLIKQTDTWEAQIPVYDASFISAVGTEKNLSIGTASDKIVYTVYEKDSGDPYLYCPIGIAKLMVFNNYEKNESQMVYAGSTVELDKYESLKNIMDPYYAGTHKPDGSNWTEREKISWNAMGDGVKEYYKGKSYTTLEASGLTNFDWNGKVSHYACAVNRDDDNKITTYNTFYTLTNAYYYIVKDYWYYGGDKAKEGYAQYNAYFDFEVIYANESLKSYGSGVTSYTDGDANVPTSGSVFEISGFSPSFTAETKHIEDEEKSIWGYIIAGLMTIVVMLLVGAFIYSTAGTGSGLGLPLAGAALKALWGKVIFGAIISGAIAAMSIFPSMISLYTTTVTTNETYLSEIFFDTNDQNLGLLSSGHTTDIVYKDGKLRANDSVGNFVIADNGEMYFYYSTIRPSDYFTKYWFVTPTLDAAEGSEVLTLSISDVNSSEIVAKDGKRYYCKDHTEGHTCKYDYEIVEKYIYDNGTYYYYPLTLELGYKQTSELAGPAASGIDSIQQDNKTFVVGQYDSSVGNRDPYKFIADPGNHLEYDATSKTYTLNGHEITSDYFAKQKQEFCYVTIAELRGTTLSNIGYNYFDTVYYAPQDGENVNDKFFKEGDSRNVRYATYTYVSETAFDATWNEGYDYITRKVNIYEQSDTGLYYLHTDESGNSYYCDIIDGMFYKDAYGEIHTISSVSNRYARQEIEAKFMLTPVDPAVTDEPQNSLREEYIMNESVDTTLAGVTVEVPIYPTTFICPYSVDITEEGYDFTYLTCEKDAEGKYTVGIFVNPNVLSAGVDLPSASAIEQEVTYFLYDAGYITDKDLNPSGVTQASKVYTKVCEKDGDNLKLNGVNISAVQITAYDVSGETHNIKIADLYTALVNETGEYDNYYLIDVSDYAKSSKWETDYKGKFNSYLVSSVYKLYNGNLYQRDDNYFVGGVTYDAAHDTLTTPGFIYKTYAKKAYKTEYDFMYNKYLTNDTWELYTQHKFTNDFDNTVDFKTSGDSGSSLEFKYKDENGNLTDFYIIPNSTISQKYFSGSPNPNHVTYLAENCKVTLGGGLTLSHLGITGKTAVSGSITIS